MTALMCDKCGLWIGTEYTGNSNFNNHICDPLAVEAVNKAKQELIELDKEYAIKRREIEFKVIKHSQQ